MATCKKCGIELEEGVKVCPACNWEVEEEKTEETEKNTSEKIEDTIKNLNNTADSTEEFDKKDIEDNKVMAILSYIGILVLIPILAAQNSKFARYHANQGLVLFIFDIIVGAAVGIVGGILLFIPIIGWIVSTLISLAAGIAVLALMIVGIINAANGKAKELPVIGKFRIIK